MRLTRTALASLAILAIATPALAATFGTGDMYTLSAPLSDDLYAAGGNVRLNERVEGDVLAAGGNVRVNSTVTQDLMAAGGDIDIRASVGDDLRLAGGTIRVEGTVRDDALIAGGDITVEGSGTGTSAAPVIGGDAKIAGGQVMIDGGIGGNADFRTSSLTLNGRVEGDAVLVAERITLGEDAFFAGTVRYWQRDGEVSFEGKMGSGSAVFDPTLQKGPDEEQVAGVLGAIYGAFSLVSFVSTIILLLLLTFLTRTYFSDAAKVLKKQPGWSFVVGLLFLILTPILAFLCLITVFGIPVGLIILALYGASLLLLSPIASLVITHWIGQWQKKNWNRWQIFGMAVAVYIVLKIIGLIPVLGWIVKWALVIMALGAEKTVKWERGKRVV